MMSYTYILIALAIVGQVRAAEEAAGAPEPYAYAYEAPDHSATEERKPDGTVSGYYTLKDADGRSRRVSYVADESGFHANVETNEHGTKTSNPADAQIMAAPATPEQLVYQQRVQYQAAPQQQTVVQQVAPQAQRYQTQRYQTSYEVPVGYEKAYSYGYGAYPASNSALYGYSSYPQSNNGYYTTTNSAYYPNSVYGAYNNGYATSHVSPASYQGLSPSSYGVGDSSVYGGYNYHTPGSYYSSVRSSSSSSSSTGGQQVVGKPLASSLK